MMINSSHKSPKKRQQPKITVRPRQENRPGSSRSRIPAPVSHIINSSAAQLRTQSPDFNPNYSPERADSGIDIYTEFETSPTNSIRRNRQNTSNRPPDIIE